MGRCCAGKSRQLHQRDGLGTVGDVHVGDAFFRQHVAQVAAQADQGAAVLLVRHGQLPDVVLGEAHRLQLLFEVAEIALGIAVHTADGDDVEIVAFLQRVVQDLQDREASLDVARIGGAAVGVLGQVAEALQGYGSHVDTLHSVSPFVCARYTADNIVVLRPV